MSAIGDLISFEPDRVEVTLDGRRLELEPGQNVVSHGIDRNLDIGEAGALTAVPQELPDLDPFDRREPGPARRWLVDATRAHPFQRKRPG